MVNCYRFDLLFWRRCRGRL